MSGAPLVVWLYGDITCPWTYLVLGRLRRLERRLDGRFALGWRPLPIGPARRDGGAESGPERAELERLGLPFATLPSPSIARDALRAVEFARDLDDELAQAVLDGLFRCGYSAGELLSSREGLLEVCETMGLDREGLSHALSDGRYDLEFERAETEAELYGIDSVPTILAGRSKLVGAAPEQLLETVILRALAEEPGPPG